LKRIEAQICLEDLDGFCGLAHIRQGFGASMVDEIGVEREASLEFGNRGVVPALVNQDISKLSASRRQAGVETHCGLRQFKGAIERNGIEIVSIERFDIGVEVSLGQHRSSARVIPSSCCIAAWRSAMATATIRSIASALAEAKTNEFCRFFGFE
jgi:hypothetical protein